MNLRVHNIQNVWKIAIDILIFCILKLACWKSLYVIDPFTNLRKLKDFPQLQLQVAFSPITKIFVQKHH